MNADRAKAKDQSLMVKQFNDSKIQRFNSSTIQQFNDSTVQRFNSSTIQQFNSSTIQQFFARSALIRLYLRPIKPLLFLRLELKKRDPETR
jgi:hypothetical protein